jgi:hypothetical protein
MEHGVRADIGVLHHEEHEEHKERNLFEIAEPVQWIQKCLFWFLDLFRALRVLRGEKRIRMRTIILDGSK